MSPKRGDVTHVWPYNTTMPATPSDRAALRQKLQRLGLRPASSTQPKPRPSPAPPPDLPGSEVETPYGAAFIYQESYTLNHQHGPRPLGDLLQQPAESATRLLSQPCAPFDIAGLLFIDTETTGLMAGDFAFVVGVGAYEADSFVLRQYFLRQPSEEPAMLHLLAEQLNQATGLVTFNGRNFDLPLLTSRTHINHLNQGWSAASLPHLDLLYPARRLWRGRLENCRLATIENALLAHTRTDEDIPGFLIPQVYREYLHTGYLADIKRVLYHNRHDVLTMVTLLAHLLTVFDDQPPTTSTAAVDVLRTALWYADRGHLPQAESAFQAALAADLPPEEKTLALRRYAGLLKSQQRRPEALALWEKLIEITPADPEPAIELAMYYEHHARDYSAALSWANIARQAVSLLPTQWQRAGIGAEIDHRCARLQRKHEAANAK